MRIPVLENSMEGLKIPENMSVLDEFDIEQLNIYIRKPYQKSCKS